MTRRTERIAGELLAELSRLLREEVTDPRVGVVTLTRIDVAPDLTHALVFWSALDLGSERVDEHQAGLDSASPFLRRRIASELPLKRSPELRFRYDPSLALGAQTLSMLASFRQRAEGERRPEDGFAQRAEGELEPDEAEGNDGPER